jgi:hypothetical protein
MEVRLDVNPFAQKMMQADQPDEQIARPSLSTRAANSFARRATEWRTIERAFYGNSPVVAAEAGPPPPDFKSLVTTGLEQAFRARGVPLAAIEVDNDEARALYRALERTRDETRRPAKPR